MGDWEVVCGFLQIAQPDADEVIGILRDAGFVRHAGIEAAYRAGFDASGEGWNGEHPGDASERPSFAKRILADLEAIRSQQREAL